MLLGGLLYSGYKLNEAGKQSRPTRNIDLNLEDKRHENKKSGGANIYTAGYFKKVNEIQNEKVINYFEKSFDPVQTNILPTYFNTLQETDLQIIPNPQFDPSSVQEQASKFGAKELTGNLNQWEPRANDMTLLNYDGSIEASGWGGITGTPSDEAGVAEFFDSPAGVVTSNEPQPAVNAGGLGGDQIGGFVHNNMVPFFGGRAKQNMTVDNRNLAGKLELFSGQKLLDTTHKNEIGPLFAPVQQDIYQQTAPRQLDRYVVNLQVRNNELPFEPVHVGPGLNQGYTSLPTDGFHPTLRVLPKTIDQLYVNPRVTNEGRVLKGRTINKRTAQQKQFKYRPEVLVTNFDGDRNFTSVGAFTKPMAYSKQVMKPTERRISRNILGDGSYAHGSVSTPNTLRQKHKISDKVTYLNTPFRNATFSEVNGFYDTTRNVSSFENKENERSVTQMRYGEGDGKPVTAPDTTQCGTGLLNNVSPNGGIEQPRTTKLQMKKRPNAGQDTQEGFVSGGGAGKTNGNLNTNSNSLSDYGSPTTDGLYPGGEQPSFKSLGYFDTNRRFEVHKNEVYLEDLPKTTRKQGTIENPDVYGFNGVPYGLQKREVYDPFDFAKTTIREQTENNKYIPIAGQAESGGNSKSYDDAYNMKQNLVKEIISQGRFPTLSGTKIVNGKESVDINIKKIESDRLNQYASMRAPVYPAGRSLSEQNTCSMTSMKNNLPSYNTRLDESLTQVFEMNPLTQSLKSWATI